MRRLSAGAVRAGRSSSRNSPGRSFSEQVRVGARALEDDLVFRHLLHEQIVEFDMALPTAPKLPDEFVVSVNRIQAIAGKQETDDSLQLFKVLAPALHSLDVPRKLSRENGSGHQMPSFRNMSSASRHATSWRAEPTGTRPCGLTHRRLRGSHRRRATPSRPHGRGLRGSGRCFSRGRGRIAPGARGHPSRSPR